METLVIVAVGIVVSLVILLVATWFANMVEYGQDAEIKARRAKHYQKHHHNTNKE